MSFFNGFIDELEKLAQGGLLRMKHGTKPLPPEIPPKNLPRRHEAETAPIVPPRPKSPTAGQQVDKIFKYLEKHRSKETTEPPPDMPKEIREKFGD